MTHASHNAPLVTGIGAVCALGAGRDVIWSALCAGQTALRPITGFDHDGLRNATAGWIDQCPNGTSEFRIDRFAFPALREALDDAGISAGDTTKRIALICGTSLGMSLVDPTLTPAPLDAMSGNAENGDLTQWAARLAAAFPEITDIRLISTACSSGTHAIGLARDLLATQEFDAVVAGGADTLDRLKCLGHSALSTLTTSLPKPFSKDRDGTLFGEGAAFLVLEADSIDRRADAYAHCVGVGYTTDIIHLTAPDDTGAGVVAAMDHALRDAGVTMDAVGHVNLHGSGTALNDQVEFTALERFFGPELPQVACTTVKGAIGHLMGAAGAIEAMTTVMALRDGQIPPTAQTQADDIAFPLDVVTGTARKCADLRHAFSLSLGFGGANGVLLFSKLTPG